jgi:hypothetical protein
MNDELIILTDAAHWLDLDLSTCWHRVKRGRLPTMPGSGDPQLFRWSGLQAALRPPAAIRFVDLAAHAGIDRRSCARFP